MHGLAYADARLILQVLHVTPQAKREAGPLRLSDESVWRCITVLVVAVSSVRPIAQGRLRTHVAHRKLQQMSLSEGALPELHPGREAAQVLFP